MQLWVTLCLCVVPFMEGVISASVRSQTTSMEKQGKHKREMWLDDITKDYLYEMQGDAPASPAQSARCPPPPKQVPNTACKASKCSSDARCGAGQRCCNNGCTFTCLPSMPVPQAIDWIREPPRRSKSGNSWLVPGKEQDEQVEWCSTNLVESDADALLCPHGYQCHIEDLGDPANGVPNRGRCVKQRKKRKNDSGRSFRLKTETADGTQCIFHDRKINDQQQFYYHHHPCSCTKGSIECQVGPSHPVSPQLTGHSSNTPPSRSSPSTSYHQTPHRTPYRVPTRTPSRTLSRSQSRGGDSRMIMISNG